MFRTFLLLRLEQNIGRKGMFSSIHRPVGTKYCQNTIGTFYIAYLTAR